MYLFDITRNSLKTMFVITRVHCISENFITIYEKLHILTASKGNMVDLLLNMIVFQRTSNRNGKIQNVREFLPYCFAHNRHNYARTLSFTLEKYPRKKGFTVSLPGESFSKIPCDQVIEMTITPAYKGTGGLSGKTKNVGTSKLWMRINHIMATSRKSLDNMIREKE